MPRLIVFTDNTNIFTSLRVLPPYNHILISMMNVLIDNDLDLRIFHIPGKDNIIADPPSWFLNDQTCMLAPRLVILNFTPPRDALGAVKK
jgi:hypothetical protein